MASGETELRGKEPKNRLNCTVFGYPSRSNLSCSGYKHLGFRAWKVRRPLQSEQGLWLTPQCGEVFSIPTELSLNGFQQKVDDSESTKVSLACVGGRAPEPCVWVLEAERTRSCAGQRAFVISTTLNPEGTH